MFQIDQHFKILRRYSTFPSHHSSTYQFGRFLIETYHTTHSSLIDKHAPLKAKFIRAKPINKWFSIALSTLKSAWRHLEQIWLNSRSPDHLNLFRAATNKYHSAIIVASKIYNLTRYLTSFGHQPSCCVQYSVRDSCQMPDKTRTQKRLEYWRWGIELQVVY